MSLTKTLELTQDKVQAKDWLNLRLNALSTALRIRGLRVYTGLAWGPKPIIVIFAGRGRLKPVYRLTVPATHVWLDVLGSGGHGGDWRSILESLNTEVA
jgi:hypothetical protein